MKTAHKNYIVPTAEDYANLTKLNTLFTKISKTGAKLAKYYDSDTIDKSTLEKINDLFAKQTKLTRQFNDLAACLPPLKFTNTDRGYMFKHDENGDETFLINFTAIKTVSIKAKSRQDAIDTVVGMLKMGQIKIDRSDLCNISDLCVKAN